VSTKVKLASTVHLPADEFQLGDLALSLSLAPGQLYPRQDRFYILAELGHEPLHLDYAATFGILHPLSQLFTCLVTKYPGEVLKWRYCSHYRELAAAAGYWCQQTQNLLQDVSPDELSEFLAGKATLDELVELLHSSLPGLRTLRSAIAEPLRLVQEPLGNLDELVALLEDGARLREIEKELEQASEALSSDFGSRFKGFDTDWDDVNTALDWTQELFFYSWL
jgi:hypothetical protein